MIDNKNKRIYILISCIFLFSSLVSASDILVWQGQYYTGTTFNTGTYSFNFSVYDALIGGNICFSNTTTLTTGNFGEWKTEQSGVNSACNNASQDYYLNININGVDQSPRKRLVVWNSLRKNVDEATSGKFQVNTQVITDNITIANYGFFNYLGSLVNKITKLFVQDIDATGNIETSENVSAKYFKGDGSLLTNIPTGGSESDPQWSANFTKMQTDCSSNNYVYGINGNGVLKCRQDQTGSNGLTPVFLENNLNASSAAYTTIFTIALTPSKMNIVKAYLAQSSPTNGVAIQNRAIISEAGPIGNCNFVTQTTAGAQAIDNIPVSTNSVDATVNTMSLDTNIPFINTITCTVLADANQKNLIIQFDSETAVNVTTYAGSYYTNAVN